MAMEAIESVSFNQTPVSARRFFRVSRICRQRYSFESKSSSAPAFLSRACHLDVRLACHGDRDPSNSLWSDGQFRNLQTQIMSLIHGAKTVYNHLSHQPTTTTRLLRTPCGSVGWAPSSSRPWARPALAPGSCSSRERWPP